MDYRKLIGFGKGSFVVSVPKSWVDRNNLAKGNMIGIEETDEGIMLYPPTQDIESKEKRITITADGKDIARIKAEIISAYLNCFDVLEVVSTDLKTQGPEIKRILHDLAGLEILEQTSGRLLAKDLINIREVSLPTLIRRMDIITRSMIEDSMKCMTKECEPLSIAQRDQDVNRLHFLAHRVIRKGFSNPSYAKAIQRTPLQLQADQLVVLRLEKVADRQKRIARMLGSTGLSDIEIGNLKKIYQHLYQAYLDVMKAYYTNDVELAYKIEQDGRIRMNMCSTFFTDHNHHHVELKKSKEQKCIHRHECGSTALILENLKAMSTSIKYLAQTIMGGGG
ncbi:MAG TPA: hypothetical protein VJH97_00430 [Candidatus Nanoarchaeia archaeon]|nr:hypothetical protein [Candidatus Nanoarchaeia archaeon]